jgi:hypothetical protein
LVLGATVTPPLLDAAVDYAGTGVESEHDPARCSVLHDHTACTQLARSLSLPGALALAVLDPDVPGDGARTPVSAIRPFRTDSPTPPPRAPPIHRT